MIPKMAFLCFCAVLQRGIKIRLNKMICYLPESPVFVIVGWIRGRSRLRWRAERCWPSLWKQQSLPSVAALLSSMCSSPKEVVMTSLRNTTTQQILKCYSLIRLTEALFIVVPYIVGWRAGTMAWWPSSSGVTAGATARCTEAHWAFT